MTTYDEATLQESMRAEGIRVVAGPGPLAEVLPDALAKLTTPPPPAGVVFLLWSNKHQAWWRPDARGYIADIAHAGRYSETDAAKYVVQSAMCGQLDQVTCMVAAPENWGQPA